MSDSIFSQLPENKHDFSTFDLSHNVLTTGQLGVLTPVLCELTNPGDVWKISAEQLIRLHPFRTPEMSAMKATLHLFYVPNRILWDGWQNFYSGKEDVNRVNGELVKGDVPIYPRWCPYVLPREGFNANFGCKSLYGQLGFPTFDTGTPQDQTYNANKIQIDEMPFRAYSLIYNEYFRDQWLIDEVDIRKDISGVSNYDQKKIPDIFKLRKRAYRKDYFTSALPFAQAGDAISIPLYGNAQTQPTDINLPQLYVDLINPENFSSISGGFDKDFLLAQNVLRPQNNNPSLVVPQTKGIPITFDGSDTGDFTVDGSAPIDFTPHVRNKQLYIPSLGVDLSNVSAATITELRRAVAAQLFAEAEARGGQRYTEILNTFFGVVASDQSLQRPQFIGSNTSNVIVSEILQTSQTDSTPQGTPVGQGINLSSGYFPSFYVEEVGWIIGILSVMPSADYFQGMPKKFTKFDRFDYFWEQFQGIGEQPILNSELYYAPNDENNNAVFGYTPRYAEYKYNYNKVNGEFRNSLNYWHLARIFGNQPLLNQQFIECDPKARIFALDPSVSDPLLINVHFNIECSRKMAFYGTPTKL